MNAGYDPMFQMFSIKILREENGAGLRNAGYRIGRYIKKEEPSAQYFGAGTILMVKERRVFPRLIPLIEPEKLPSEFNAKLDVI